jgi:hypothetical protein
MTNSNSLLLLMKQLDLFELGDPGIFGDWLDGTVWCCVRNLSKARQIATIKAMDDAACAAEVNRVLDILEEYASLEIGNHGIFDSILVAFGRDAKEDIDDGN